MFYSPTGDFQIHGDITLLVVSEIIFSKIPSYSSFSLSKLFSHFVASSFGYVPVVLCTLYMGVFLRTKFALEFRKCSMETGGIYVLLFKLTKIIESNSCFSQILRRYFLKQISSMFCLLDKLGLSGM